MSRRPIIGITPTPSVDEFPHGSFYRYCLADTYVKSVRQAGGTPVILPAGEDRPLEMLDALDGLILSGGGDIAPSLFTDGPAHQKTARIDDQRDSFEIALMHAAAQRDMPTLAICRGIQVMGVAFGANLHQHVPDCIKDEIGHQQQVNGISQHEPSHLVDFTTGHNPVRELIGASTIMVNSFHHQALAEVPEPLRLAGQSSDGLIEAIWHPEMTFGIGVQWHPEMLALTMSDHAALFDGLASASRVPATATV